MKLIIDIPEDMYNYVKTENCFLNGFEVCEAKKSIANGIPLKDIELVDKKILINTLRTEFDYDDVYMPRHFEDIVDDAYELTKEFDFRER